MLNNVSEIIQMFPSFYRPNKFIFRKVVRILALVFLFIRNLKAKRNINSNLTLCSANRLLNQFGNCNDKYLVTQQKNSTNNFPFNSPKGLVDTLNDDILMTVLNYFYVKATFKLIDFNQRMRIKISPGRRKFFIILDVYYHHRNLMAN